MTSIRVRIGGVFRRMGTNFVNYLKILREDYTTACVETAQGAWENKLRTLIYASIFACGVQAVRTNPTFEDYVRDVIGQRHELLMLGDGERNAQVASRLADVALRVDQERLKRLNLFLCSIIYKADAGSRNCLYSEHCKPLRPKWRHYWREYVWDIGAFGHWYHLQRNFSDYDVSEETLALPDRRD